MIVDSAGGRAPNPAVLCRLDGPIPLSALRELVGLCRALYVDWTCSDAESLDLEELAEIGLELSHALNLARSTAPDSVGHRSAWARAEAASERLGVLVAKTRGIEGGARREGAHGGLRVLKADEVARDFAAAESTSSGEL